ncbi:GAF domain-containing sensor histidine kinase [Stigmatella sp. ncwal1]|uniref:histidine kinase n=1 Tax=Stigmatella ashevillensis TaxID=2995309 RepID=A0ABT5DAQ8_9BACT|nr:GAF domain-containing sensor histidine kinase [Stigmatella ashevillena]MDC0709893.1 GAF domain-containing sensor histidine kinase [Stigmatella ashevillena]
MSPTPNIPLFEEEPQQWTAQDAGDPGEHAGQALRLLARAGRLLSVQRGSLKPILRRVARLTTSGLASFCMVELVRPNGQFERVALAHHDPQAESQLRALHPHSPQDSSCSPWVDALHSGTSQLLVDYPVEIRRRLTTLPEHLSQLEGLDPRSLMVVPLVGHRRVLGLMLLARDGSLPPFDATDLIVAEELARSMAVALDDSRLLREARRAERRARFLARSSRVLAGSLNYRATLDQVARLAVPTVADLCAVDMLEEDGSISRLAVAHRVPEKAALVWELAQRWPSHLQDLYGSGHVIQTGEPELRGEVQETGLPRAARDPEHLRALRALGLESYLVAPLRARGRTLGVITFAYTGSHRSYRQSDLRLAMELAARAALAVDNALLYGASQEAVRLRDEFLAVASHELKTPLTPLNLRLQSLRRELDRRGSPVDPARVKEHVAALQRQCKRLGTLVDSLLDVSRLEAGVLELDLEFLDLAALVREVISRFAPQAARTGTLLNIQAGEPIVGHWDRVRLEQVVSSLLSNALKYGVGHPVHIRAGRGPQGARLTVRDEGIGISPEHLPRIFERFERAVSAEHFGGLGLGLYLTRHLVEAFGGTILATSEPGHGSTFQVDLPLASPAS